MTHLLLGRDRSRTRALLSTWCGQRGPINQSHNCQFFLLKTEITRDMGPFFSFWLKNRPKLPVCWCKKLKGSFVLCLKTDGLPSPWLVGNTLWAVVGNNLDTRIRTPRLQCVGIGMPVLKTTQRSYSAFHAGVWAQSAGRSWVEAINPLPLVTL